MKKYQLLGKGKTKNIFLKPLYLSVLAVQFLSSTASAILDEDNDGMSDVWENKYGFIIETNAPPEQSPFSDPDGDGWSNMQECLSGTNPFSGASSEGILHPTIVIDRLLETVTLKYNTVIGKKYQLQTSEDFIVWTNVEASYLAYTFEYEHNMIVSPMPPKLFFRVEISDTDTDNDSFTDYEEYILNTDPTVADRDRDGLPDYWEIQYGLNPDDDGSTNVNNGAEGDSDGDGTINSDEYNNGTDPTNATSYPNVDFPESKGGIGSDPILLSEAVRKDVVKYGFDDFKGSEGEPKLYKRYLKKVTDLDFHTDDEKDSSHNTGVFTTTEICDKNTGEYVTDYAGEWSAVDLGIGEYQIISATVEKDGGESTGTYYDEAEEKTKTFPMSSETTITLSEEYTTQMLKDKMDEDYPQFTGVFHNGIDQAIRMLIPETTGYENHYTLQKMQYKWQSYKKLPTEQVSWLEIFKPYVTPGKTPTPPTFTLKKWQSTGIYSSSPLFKIEPEKNGTYTISHIKFKCANYLNGWDPINQDPVVAVVMGTPCINNYINFANSSSYDRTDLELAVDGPSAKYISINNPVINTGGDTQFEINGIKPTENNVAARILIRSKTSKVVAATLLVKVFPHQDVNVALYYAWDSSKDKTEIINIQEVTKNALKKMNETYNKQAGLFFTDPDLLSTIPLTIIDVNTPSTDPRHAIMSSFFSSETGAFNYEFTYSHNGQTIPAWQAVRSLAQTPSKTLPIIFVNKIYKASNPKVLGSTYGHGTDPAVVCYVSMGGSPADSTAHEVGHALFLSTEKAGKITDLSHDVGYWPQEVIDQKGSLGVGLMFHSQSNFNTTWLRYQDWQAASQTAKEAFTTAQP